MTRIEVRSQVELDAALEGYRNDPYALIIILSEPGVWLCVDDSGSATVRAWGSATVEAWGSATVEAGGSATVKAGGSATVEVWGSATVKAWGSATVKAGGSATVKAAKYVAVHLHSQQVTLSGGAVIDMTSLDQKDTQTWLDYNGLEADEGGLIHLYKAVNDSLESEYSRGRFTYQIGSTVTPEKWVDNHECGNGIHACPAPFKARQHYLSATRFLEVTVPVADIRPIDWGKCKAPAVTVLREVTIDGEPVAGDAL